MENSDEKATNDYKQKFLDVTNDMIQLNKQLDGLKKENEELKKNLENLKAESEKDKASLPEKIAEIKPPIPEKVEEIKDESISVSVEKRRTCPKCGNQNLRQIREIVDKTKIISVYPRMYGKKYICGECGTEWG